jgi:hypothetical protein
MTIHAEFSRDVTISQLRAAAKDLQSQGIRPPYIGVVPAQPGQEHFRIDGFVPRSKYGPWAEETAQLGEMGACEQWRLVRG